MQEKHEDEAAKSKSKRYLFSLLKIWGRKFIFRISFIHIACKTNRDLKYKYGVIKCKKIVLVVPGF